MSTVASPSDAAPVAHALSACCDGPPPEIGHDLGWGLSMVSRAFTQLAASSVGLVPGGRRGYLVLATVARGAPRSQLALAQQLGVDKTAMTYLLDELEGAGLIERRPDPADRRVRQLLITDLGRTALHECTELLRNTEDTLLAPLDSTEVAAFAEMLDRIARAAQGIAGESSDQPDRSDQPV
jgi:DNA-binding MarR family transcriptional regulator